MLDFTVSSIVVNIAIEKDQRCVSSRPTGRQDSRNLVENRTFQANLKDLLEMKNRANLRFARKMTDFNTLVLKSGKY